MATPIRLQAPVVSQRDLSLIVGIENQIRALQRERDRHCSDVIDLLLSGCSVQPGEHVTQLAQSGAGATRQIRLVIDGRELD